MKTRKSRIQGGNNSPTNEEEMPSTSAFHKLSNHRLKKEREISERERKSTIGRIIEQGTFEPQLPSPPNLYRSPKIEPQTKEQLRINADIRRKAQEGLDRQIRGTVKKIQHLPKDKITSTRTKNPFSPRIPKINPFSVIPKLKRCISEKKTLMEEIEKIKSATYPQKLQPASFVEYNGHEDGAGKKQKKSRKRNFKKRTKHTKRTKRTKRKRRRTKKKHI
jgi:hypothetical protein